MVSASKHSLKLFNDFKRSDSIFQDNLAAVCLARLVFICFFFLHLEQDNLTAVSLWSNCEREFWVVALTVYSVISDFTICFLFPPAYNANRKIVKSLVIRCSFLFRFSFGRRSIYATFSIWKHFHHLRVHENYVETTACVCQWDDEIKMWKWK